MAHPHRTYQPRDTEHSVLHAVIREHLEPFLREVSDRGDGSGLPRFVEQEFREFLTCGVLAHGFTRLRCADCTFERLLPFSCKRRGFCPSCGGRRMAERAAYLVDEVLPRVPVRQWVLTLPYRLRYRLAWDHALCRAVLGVYARVLSLLSRMGPRTGEAVRLVVDLRWRPERSLRFGGTDIAPPSSTRVLGALRPSPWKLTSVREHGMSFEPQAATPRAAASFSAGVRPCSVIENRSVL